MKSYITLGPNGVLSYNGPDAIQLLAMRSLAIALRSYAKHRVQLSRVHSPKHMMHSAERYTGQRFAARDYMGAADALALAADDLMREKVEVRHDG